MKGALRRVCAALAVAPLVAAIPGQAGDAHTAAAASPEAAAPRQEPVTVPGSPYYAFELRPPGQARRGPSGTVTVGFPETPFGVAVTAAGHYVLDLRVSATGLRGGPGTTFVAWVATPDLERLVRLGPVGADEPVRGRVDFDNKFLVFVTREAEPGVERPGGRIVLQGVSRSGRMESMFSHGFCPPGEYC